MKYLISLILLSIVAISELCAQPTFIPLGGDGPLNFRELEAGNQGELYGRTDKELWMSTDQGLSWKVQFSFEYMPGYDLLVSPNGNLYLGGEVLIRSTDRGLSWIRFDSLLPGNKTILAVDSERVIVAMNGYMPVMTSDKGKTWNQIEGIGGSIGRYYLRPNNEEFVYSYSTGGLLRSIDKGVTWRSFHTPGYFLGFGINGKMYSYNDSIVSVSSNRGTTWNIRSSPERYHYPQLVVDSSGIIFYYSLQGEGVVWYSTDDGATWNTIKTKWQPYGQNLCVTPWGKVYAFSMTSLFMIEEGEAQAISTNISQISISCFARDEGGRVWVTGQGISGLFMSTDEGENWNIREYNLQSFFIKDLEPAGARMWAAAYTYDTATPAGVYFTEDLGKTWVLALETSADTGVNAVLEIDGVVIAATSPSGIMRSTDGGISWQESNEGVTNGIITDLISDDFGRVIAESLNGIFISHDKGRTWKRSDIRFPNPPISTIAVDALGRILVGTHEGLYRTLNERDWERVFIGLLDWQVNGLAIDRFHNIFVGRSDNQTLYVSSDLGRTWKCIGSISSPYSYNYLYSLWADQSGFVYAGMAYGFYRTDVLLSPARVPQKNTESPATLIYGRNGFNVSVDDPDKLVSVSLFDQTGRLVASCEGNARLVESQLDMAVFNSKGWYGYQLISEGKSHRGTLIVFNR